MNGLTPEQFQHLHAILLAAFDADELAMLVRFTYPPEFIKTVDWKSAQEVVVTQLLTKLEERADLEPLARGLLKARPKREDVVAFCHATFPPGTFEEHDAGTLVTQATGGLSALIAILNDPDVRFTAGLFQGNIDTVRNNIRTLTAYKVLHDSLHNLDQRLPSIVDAVAKPRTDVVATLQLRRATIDLTKEAGRARDAAALTPAPGAEDGWINDLVKAVQALKEATDAANQGNLSAAVEALRALLQESARINGQLCAVAGNMRLEKLIEALGAIVKQLPGDGAPGATAARLRDGLAGLKGLQAEFVRRVTEHTEWQWLDKQLKAADSSPAFDPAQKVPHWPEVCVRLDRLCSLYPAEEWYAELKEQRGRWESAARKGDPAAATIEGDTFRALASNRFFDVDGELNKLCERLNEVSLLLDTLLRVLTDGHA